ncbi:FIG000605: protein co-occurring with transport systems (COG1739) [hydrothermal vent metagenome]|uniref:FIG000605: protein co-occurring with transport systems (COG1739) n=1 Tax=hydrothermal vent metagenome TaxID=652676 RepID=A0A3B0TDW7_9ZZZZ
MDDTYKTIKQKAEGVFKDKGSKFLSFAFPVQNEQEIKEIIHSLKKKHHSARHHCYAWRLGAEEIRFRANDDGEPSSTAGKPILGQLISYGLTNTLIVVARYFGGTLLGASGLVNAYKNAASDALNNAEIVENLIETIFKIDFTYNELNKVMSVIKNENLKQLKTDLLEDCSIIFAVRKSEASRVEKIFKDIFRVEITPAKN